MCIRDSIGAGRTETARLLFGADRLEHGVIRLDGKRLRIKSPRDAIRQGICLLTEDRKTHGLVLGQTARENFGLPNLSHFTSLGFIRQREESREFLRYVDQIRIKIANPEQITGNLSGGNQQKVVLAKWLTLAPQVLLLDEPTRGIDVGAKEEIYRLMEELAANGVAVLFASSEMEEILGMSDRALVMYDGRIAGQFQRADLSEEAIMHLATGRAA